MNNCNIINSISGIVGKNKDQINKLNKSVKKNCNKIKNIQNDNISINTCVDNLKTDVSNLQENVSQLQQFQGSRLFINGDFLLSSTDTFLAIPFGNSDIIDNIGIFVSNGQTTFSVPESGIYRIELLTHGTLDGNTGNTNFQNRIRLNMSTNGISGGGTKNIQGTNDRLSVYTMRTISLIPSDTITFEIECDVAMSVLVEDTFFQIERIG